ncbi:MAG: SpoIIE family protein phosphatase [Deltaproteobacteria bacterium]|jgi:sigma-B regulation protein RsbU (phosphoserine phosphatase)|nr:SpoIIE family protein phosphatase [Deltaproteobacteria bacterium]
MRFRWKLLILLIVIAMVPVLVMRTFGVHGLRRLGTELVSRTSENLVVGAQQQLHLVVDSYSQMLWQGREQLELALLVQAKEVERALAHEPEATGQVYFAADFAAGHHVPIDLSPSADHFREQDGARPTMMTVAYSAQVFALAPDVRRTDVAADLARLDPLTPVYQDLHQRLPGNVIWHYTSLANGLHSAYPAHGDLPAGYDPRRQFWYQEAFKLKTPWVDQFVDPETGQKVVAAVKTVKRPDGTTAGVTALIIPVSRIFERRVLVNNIPAETTAFMVYFSSEPDGGKKGARVLAQIDFDDSRQRVWRAPRSSDWLITDENEEFRPIIADFEMGESNMRRINYKGCDCLWVYGPTHQEGYLVLIAPYDEILKPARQAEAYIQTQINELLRITRYGVGTILAVVVFLAFAFSRTVTKPMQILADGAELLAAGHFDTRVDIRSRDEFGEMGRVFNAVGPQLEANYQMRKSLDLAKEVQQNLLPAAPPEITGLDIAGKSVYCEETGGDYYDYFYRGDRKVDVMVGDVAGHGISSALLMATARAFLRLRSALPGAIKEIVADVNAQLCKDVQDSGDFMTLFYSEINARERDMCWVSAGHDPALLFDPVTDSFTSLSGKGLPLGVDENAVYDEAHHPLIPGNIIIIGTDGIWEAPDQQGDMFGKDRLQDLVRTHAGQKARQILEAVITAVEAFQGPGRQRQDDITLTIIKIEQEGASP